MPISLQKGQKVSLTKGNPGLQKLVVGIGWDINRFDTGGDFDLDSAAFLITENGKVSKQEDFVFFGNLVHPSGSVQHLGDNLTGAG
ncbi:MAG: TerD family protein, partial [Lachnospiraceae bacterium]|nr:TerD family protein [Lachnospiraceae bacterium]